MINRHLTVSLIILSYLLAPNIANAYCSEPSMYGGAPSAPGSFSKPSPPYCLSGYGYTRSHTCSDWEIDSYIDGVNDYIRKLNNFANEARDFANSAINFANDAADYANCEAKDVKSEFE